MAVNNLKVLRYQQTLRAIGAWLDECQAAYFSVFETPDGFTVVIIDPLEPPSPREEHFPLHVLGRQHDQLRQLRGRKQVNVDGKAALFGTGRQDFFHALGYELDDIGAESVVVDQIDDAVMLSYAYVDPSADFSWHKRMVLLSRDDIETVTKVARGRRQPDQRSGLFDGFRRNLRSSSTR